MKRNNHKKQSRPEVNKLDALVANFFIKPVLDAVSEDCSEWKQGVRLLSYGLLKSKAEKKVTEHVKQCSSCRLFLLDCLNAQRAFLDGYLAKTGLVADRMGNGKEAFVRFIPASQRTRAIKTAQEEPAEDAAEQQAEAAKDTKNGKK